MNPPSLQRLLILALAAFVLLVGAFLLGPGQEQKALQGSSTNRQEQSDSLTPDLAESNRTSASTSEVTALDNQQQATSTPATKPVIIGFVLDAAELPVEGASVQALSSPNASFNTYDLEFEPEQSVQATDQTGPDGSFRLEVPEYRPFKVLATAEGYAAAEQESCYAGQSITLRIHTGCELHGRFTAAADGTPIADVRFRVFSDSLAEPLEGLGVADGSYQMSSLPAGEAALQVIPLAHAMPRLIETQLVPGRPTELNVSLESGRMAKGQVRDALTGTGIAGAEVSSWSFLGKTVRTDVHGFYELRGIRETRSSLQARAVGYGRQQRSFALGDETVDFELQPAASVKGRVIDVSGNGLAGVTLSACAASAEDGLHEMEWQTAVSDDRGEFHIQGLRADLRLLLFARLANYATLTLALPLFEQGEAQLVLDDVVLSAHSVLSGRLLGADALPIAGRTIRLLGPREAPGAGTDLESYLHVRMTVSDRRGRFSFADLGAGTYELQAVGMESCPAKRTVVLGDGEHQTQLDWMLDRSNELRGRVLGPDGGALSGVSITLQSLEVPPLPALRMATSSEGEFGFDAVCAGRYSLFAAPSLDDKQLAPAFLPEVTFDGRPLELRLTELNAEIRGRITDHEGHAVPLALVAIDYGSGVRTGGTLTDTVGQFTIQVPAGRSFAIRVWLTKPLDLTEGTSSVQEFTLGRRILEANQPVASLEGVSSNSGEVRIQLQKRP